MGTRRERVEALLDKLLEALEARLEGTDGAIGVPDLRVLAFLHKATEERPATMTDLPGDITPEELAAIRLLARGTAPKS